MAIVLRNAMAWDGVSPEPRPADVTCEDEWVVRVDRAGQGPAVTSGDMALDLGGAFLLPGLIDAHVHLVWSGTADPAVRVEREGEQLTVLRAGAHAYEHLAAGITTIRDLGSSWDVSISVARAIDRGILSGPTVIASGRTVIMTGGHDPFWGVASDGVDAVIGSVRQQVFRGAGVIKTASTGGVYGRPEGEDVHDCELSLEELSALTGEAHRRGRKVAAHALGAKGIDNAVRAGVDTIEHGIFLTEETAARMLQQGTALCPTVQIYRRIAQLDQGDGGPVYAAAKAREVVEQHGRSVRMAVDMGIQIIAGTDAGSVNMPHPSLIDEMEALTGMGLPSRDVLVAATSAAASALGRPELGGIRVGGRADLIMVDGDPFADAGLLRSIWGVVGRGAFVRNSKER